MRKSFGSVIARNRNTILLLGVLLCLCVFSVVTWRIDAQRVSEKGRQNDGSAISRHFENKLKRIADDDRQGLGPAAPATRSKSEGRLPANTPDANPLIYAYDYNSDHLISFRADTPGTLITNIPMPGLDTANDETITGLDFRPVDGVLYGVASKPGFTSLSREVTIDTTTGVVTTVNAASLFTSPNGVFFGMDFNPVVDRIRYLSDGDINYRLNPIDGTVASMDTPLAYAAGDPHENADPTVVHTAYTNNTPGATSTTLYGIDSGTNTLVTIGSPGGSPISPNSGQLFTVGNLGVNATSFGALDIQQGTGVAYAALRVSSVSRLYRVDLSTGAVTMIGTIGSQTAIDGLSIAPLADASSADLSITKTDGVTEVLPGTATTYTITATNAGPDPVVGARVTDALPAAIASATWTCTGSGGGSCSAAGTGSINESVDLPVAGSVTFTVIANISPSASGDLVNTASVATPAGVVDPTPGDNSATDTDTILTQADLSITKTDGVTTAVPGGTVTYTITASNGGPVDALGSTVTDTFPAAITSASWTCVGSGGGTCTANGTGNINDTVDLPNGGSVTYTVTAQISPSATGTLSNAAAVAAPVSVTDPNLSNNSAKDDDELTPQADLSITKTDGVTTYMPGGATVYTIAATNNGPSSVIGATVTDALPAAVTSANWTCSGAGGGTCTASGNRRYQRCCRSASRSLGHISPDRKYCRTS